MKRARNYLAPMAEGLGCLRLTIAVLIAGSAAFAQSVAVAPSNDPSISPGATQQFTATVTGFTVSGAIGWYAAGQQGGNPANGTITAGGLYKAPASVPAKNPVTVTAIATDTAGKAHLSSVYITIAPPATAAQYTLTVGNGTGGGTYAAGAVVTIAANAGPAGEVFASWSGATVANPTAATTTLVMPAANTTAVANYGYTLTVVNGTGGGTYSAGTVVTIRANTAPAGELFSSWSGAIVANATASTTTITMSGDTNLAVTAQYSGPVVTKVSPNPMPTGTVAVTVTGTGFQTGATIWDGGVQLPTVQPTANTLTASDWHAASTTSATITVHNPGPAISNSVVVPVSGTVSYTLTVVNGSGSGSYPAGTAVSITANAASAGQNFADWTGAVVANPSAKTTTINMPASNTVVTANYAAALVVTPATATVELGATQQFSAGNVTNWSAGAGSITSTGLYTAPAAMTASGTDTVTAKGPGGTGTATVTLQNYPAPAITSLNPAALPPGSFTATVTGTGFTAQSTAALGGTPLVVTSQTASSLGVKGFASITGPVNLIVSNGSAASAPLPVLVGNPSAQVSAAAARRFLEQAAFGPTPADAANVQALGFAGQWQSSIPTGLASTGWGGRIADQVQSSNAGATFPAMTSTNGSSLFLTGQQSFAANVPTGSATLLNYGNAARLAGLQQLLTFDNGLQLVQAANSTLGRGESYSNALSGALAGATLATQFPAGNPLAAQLQTVARIIKVRGALGLSRQIFYCQLDGFDTHSGQLAIQAALLQQLSQAVLAFYQATQELGVDSSVTTFTASEFGRSLTPNSTGTDHAWGSHHFVIGTGVKGGKFFGQFPSLTLGSDYDATGTGTLIPTTSVDQYGATLAQWFGVGSANLPAIFPNIRSFPTANVGILG